jgi:hemerythrin-like domain-containing protein
MDVAGEENKMQILPFEHSFDEPLGLLSDCHRRIEKFLAILIKVAEEAPEVLTPIYHQALVKALDYFLEAAPKHTLDEEDSLFPRLAGDPSAAETIRELSRDHLAADVLHREVEKIGRGWLAQALTSQNRNVLTESLKSLQTLYLEHIRIEDNQLFPLAAKLLPVDDLREIGQEMARRRGLQP